ncbi:hypothetical protein Htur_4806 (plasmid) [Haloterrigena turkmenica DSM 5511]|uniref:Uncharacterized protein n=1 Tax=Haloterrigena turkmenica (strain ATCC 51198 / DSM 5511 / JCM 9101 / NCIMB 13204 / VKM B-1734 / 4k) TaxID=543526 RepID=D2S2H8_HALTV|nr:hypothetical protein Htur_4806 [Haloterrigena turkmenica DSM 5511]
MSENAAEWDRIARRLLYDELAHHTTDRLEQAVRDVAEDSSNATR